MNVMDVVLLLILCYDGRCVTVLGLVAEKLETRLRLVTSQGPPYPSRSPPAPPSSGRPPSGNIASVLLRASPKPELECHSSQAAHRWWLLEAQAVRRQAEQCAWPEPACSLVLPEHSRRCLSPHARLSSPALPGTQRFSAPKQRKRTWALLCATSRRGSCLSSLVRRRVRDCRLHASMAPWTTPHQSTHAEPALRIPNYKECVAEKGHEVCANLLPSRAGSSKFIWRSRRRRSAPQVLPVALRARHRRRRLTHGYVILGPAVHLRAGHVLLQSVFACVKINQ